MSRIIVCWRSGSFAPAPADPLWIVLDVQAGSIYNIEIAQNGATAAFALSANSRPAFDQRLSKEIAGSTDRRLATLEELEEDGDAALLELRDALRKRLEKLDVDVAAGGFFGAKTFGGASFSASLSLRLARLLSDNEADQGGAILRAQASAAVQIMNGAAPINATANWTVTVEEGAAKAALDIAAENISALDLSFPDIDFASLNFAAVALPELSARRFLGFLPKSAIKFDWTTPTANISAPSEPTYQLTLTGNDLVVATLIRGNGSLLYDGAHIADITNFELTFTNGVIDLLGTFEAAPAATINFSKTTSLGNLRAKISGKTCPTIFDGPETLVAISVTTEVKSLEIYAVEDPKAVLEVSFTLTSTWNNGGVQGEVDTKLTAFKVLRPTPINIASALIEALQGVILVGLDVPATGLGDVLETLGRILAAVVKTLAKGAALIAQALLDLVAAFARALADLASAANDRLRIQIYLDAESLALRQIRIFPKRAAESVEVAAGGFKLEAPTGVDLGLLLAFEEGRIASGALIADINNVVGAKIVTLETDLWLSRADGLVEAARDEAIGNKASRLIKLTVSRGEKLKNGDLIVIAGLAGREQMLFRTAVTYATDGALLGDIRLASGLVSYRDLDFGVGEAGADLKIEVKFEPQRALPFLTSGQSKSSGGLAEKLKQYVEVRKVGAAVVAGRRISIPLGVTVKLEGLSPIPRQEGDSPLAGVEGEIVLAVDLGRMTARLSGAKRLAFRDRKFEADYRGLKLSVHKRNDLAFDEPFTQFYLDFTGGDPRLVMDLAGEKAEAAATLSYEGMASGGRALVFDIENFAVSRNGVDLTASVRADPIVLKGVNTPFTFSSGRLVVVNGEVLNATIAGSGQLPPKLVGEAVAEVAISLGRRSGANLKVIAAQGALTTAKPLVCEGTRFRFRIDELGFDYREDDGEHFFFLLTGEAQFKPVGGEFSSGILKHLAKTKLALRRAPLTGDARVLARHISFQVPIDPPASARLFDIFKFQLKGIGFHPASPAFSDRPPAISISGQVAFTPGGDSPNARIDFHELWIAPAKDKGAPRFRMDGLGVELRAGSAGRISGRALAVDTKNSLTLNEDGLPLFVGDRPITAEGFLAQVRIDLSAWAPVSGVLGALELRTQRTDGTLSAPRHAFFSYGQGEKLSQPFTIISYTVYLQEVGFGFGFRYTLAGIAAADNVTTPQHLVRVLDDISARQGNLTEFSSWSPEAHGDRLTLAMRAMFSLTSASQPQKWNEAGEEKLSANPLLFDVVLALRSDMTLLMTGRAWLCTTYWDWTEASSSADWKKKPSVKGYLYLSAPRQTMLARMLSDGTGVVGEKPPLSKELKGALQRLKWSTTLYVTPSIFHVEFGWPYELEFSMGDKDHFLVTLKGGMVHRIEDGAALFGIAFKGIGYARFGGRVGGRRFGALAEARADFAVDSKFIALISARNKNDTLFYGAISLDVTIGVRVLIWLEFKIFRKRIRFEFGFSFRITISVAIELALQPNGLGGRAKASISVRGFGRTLSIGIGFSFNAGRLADARARVARFMTLGLGANYPDPETNIVSAPLPKPEASREARARLADKALIDEGEELEAAGNDEAADESSITPRPPGRQILGTNYWAILYPLRADKNKFVMQFIPRDHTDVTVDDIKRSSFYAEPPEEVGTIPEFDHVFIPKAGAELPAFKQLRAPHKTKDLCDWNQESFITKADWGETVIEEDGETASLRDVFHEMFMGNLVAPETKYSEPAARCHQLDLEQLTRAGEAERLSMSSRQRELLSTADAIEAEVDERRSAFIGAIGECAASIAELADENGDVASLAKMDARLLGLTFLVSRAEIAQLFDVADTELGETPPPANFTISNRTWVDGIDTPVAGAVELFNPPSSFFEIAQPRLAGLRSERGSKGVSLIWDLEPAWGASKSIYNDPEFRLAYYRIERVARGISNARPFSTTAKRSACGIQRPTTTGAKEFVGIAAAAQFVDDLVDLGEEIAAAVLNRTGDSKKSHYDLWSDAQLKGEVSLIYTITPVDIGGSAGQSAVIEHIIPRPEPARRPVSHARMEFHYKKMPTLATRVSPKLKLTIYDKDAEIIEPLGVARRRAQKTGGQPTPDENALRYEILVETTKVTSIGRFCDDVDVANSIPLVERCRRYSVIIDAAANGPERIDLGFLTDADDGGFNEVVLRATLQPLDGGPPFSDLLNLRELPPADGVRASRLFIRAIEQGRDQTTSSDLAPVDSIIEIGKGRRPTDPPPVSSPVPRFEQPINLAFKALDFEDIVAEAGRAYFLVPSAEGSLLEFVEAKERSTRLIRDPERRAAIQIRFNVPPIATETVGGLSEDYLNNLLGGFDLFTLEFQHLPQKPERVMDAKHIASHARRLGRLEILPPDLGTPPFETGPLHKVEAFYPSETARRTEIANRGRRAPWFSAAESFLAWPTPVRRRQILLSMDEAAISTIFKDGRPVSLKAMLLKKGEENSPPQDVDTLHKTGERLTPSDVRAWLRDLALDVGESSQINGEYTLDVSKSMKDTDPTIKAYSIDITFATRFHAIIEETLAALHWSDDGRYRQYDLAVEGAPQLKAATPLEFLQETGAEEDPFGWGALRTLGLAASLRIFDTEKGRYLTGDMLERRVEEAFRKVWSKYTGEGDDTYGSPFVELMVDPDILVESASYDGGPPAADVSGCLKNLSSLVQISLRPTPVQLLRDMERSATTLYAQREFNADLNIGLIKERRSEFHLFIVEAIEDGKPVATKLIVAEKEYWRPQNTPEILPENIKLGPGALRLTIVPKPGFDERAFIESLNFGRLTSLPLAAIDSKRENAAQLEGEERELFGLFDDRTPDWLAVLSLPHGDAAEIDRQEMTDAQQLQSRLNNLILHRLPDKPLIDEEFEQPGFFAALLPWQRRFFDFGRARIATVESQIQFALATIPHPDPWRRPVRADGTVDVVIFEKDRWAHQRSFAVRPFGRYEAFADALYGKDGALTERTLDGALDGRATTAWTTIDLPRTEPVAAPVILSARRVDVERDGANRPGTELELVVARPPDETLADSNLIVDGHVQSHGFAVGFWRDLPSISWAQIALKIRDDTAILEPLPEIGDKFKPAAVPAPLVTEDIKILADAIPTLWQGGIAHRIADTPYFYRTHAAVFAASGVVVSEIATAVFPEGGYQLKLPFNRDSGKLLWEPVWLVEMDGLYKKTILKFEIPLSRFGDNMLQSSYDIWAPKPFDDSSVFATPDPLVFYRLSLGILDDARTPTSIAAEFEIRPKVNALAQRDMYFPTFVGATFGGATASVTLGRSSDATTKLTLSLTFPVDYPWVKSTAALSGHLAHAVADCCEAGGPPIEAIEVGWRIAWPIGTTENLRDFVEFVKGFTPPHSKVARQLVEVARNLEAREVRENGYLQTALSELSFELSAAFGVSPKRLFDGATISKPVVEPERLSIVSPPTRDDIRVAAGGCNDLEDLLLERAQSQLFGEGAEPVLEGFRGLAEKLFQPFERSNS